MGKREMEKLTGRVAALEEALQRLEDERAVERAFVDYNRVMDYGGGLEHVFADDVALRVTDGRGRVQRTAQSLEDYEAHRASLPLPPERFEKHLAAAPVIEIAGDEATAENYFAVLDDDGDGPFVSSYGLTRNRLVRRGDRWLITSREAEVEAVSPRRERRRPAVTEALDERACVASLLRYTRGVDRLDDELVLSAFHADALCFHEREGHSPAEFLAWYRNKPPRASCQHYVTNHTVELDGDTAHGESYWTAVIRPEGRDLQVRGGRYVLRFDRRDGEWKIAVMSVLTEWVAERDGAEIARLMAEKPPIVRDASDLSYVRPLDEAAVQSKWPTPEPPDGS
jgi:hypothetical protein